MRVRSPVNGKTSRRIRLARQPLQGYVPCRQTHTTSSNSECLARASWLSVCGRHGGGTSFDYIVVVNGAQMHVPLGNRSRAAPGMVSMAGAPYLWGGAVLPTPLVTLEPLGCSMLFQVA